jgi:hypothetical protein
MESMSPALLKVEAVKGNSTQILATIVRKNQVYKHHPILRYSSPKRTLKLIFALTVITDGTSMKKPPPPRYGGRSVQTEAGDMEVTHD